MLQPFKRLHIIGRKNHGKTSLVVDLIAELTARGLRVGSVKHTHHRHELDVPGKDSYRHRMAGSSVVGILSPSMSAIFLPAEHHSDVADRYSAFAGAFSQCDLVLVEGDVQTHAPKLEVWRAELGTAPLVSSDDSILGVVTDDALPIAANVFPRSNLVNVTDWIVQTIV